MPKRKQIETSIEAYRSLDVNTLNERYRKIIAALGELLEADFEQIAAKMKVPKETVWKRLSELQKMGFIYRPGNMNILKSGRKGYTWMLTTVSMPKTDAEVKYNKKQETAAEKAVTLIQALPLGVQQNLFN